MKRAISLILPLAAACSSLPSLPHVSLPDIPVTSRLHPYRIDVRQGNFVSQEMVAQLKPGQSKDQVRFILGTPLVADPFHADRWDYLYRFEPGSGAIQQRHLTVLFDHDKLARVAGDVVAEQPGAAAAAPPEESGAREIEIPADKSGSK